MLSVLLEQGSVQPGKCGGDFCVTWVRSRAIMSTINRGISWLFEQSWAPFLNGVEDANGSFILSANSK